MRILDKYIIKELLGPFIFGIAAFSSVFIGTGTLFRIAQYITKYGAPIDVVTRLFLYSLPGIVVLTFPMSMLLASLLAFGRLSGSSEITAMRSGGVSFYRLALPVFVVAFGVSIFAVAFNEYVVPQANERYNNIVKYEIEKNTAPKSQEHIIIKEIKGDSLQRLTYARRYEASSNTLFGVTVQEFDNNGNLTQVENAETANWQSDRWIMHNGTIHDLSVTSNTNRVLQFVEQVLPVTKDPQAISRDQKKQDEMSMRELRQEIKLLKSQYVSTANYEVELYQRVTVPLASFVFALIGTPLGLQPHRSSSSIGLGLSIIIIFIYYAIMTVTTALGQGGALPPLLAAWLPDLIGMVVGAYLVRKSSK